MSAPDPGSLWTVGDVADFLKVSDKKVLEWVKKGKLPSLDVFGELRFEPGQVIAAIRPQTVEPRHSVSEAVTLISLNNLCSAVGLHRTTIYRKVRAGRFPRPVRLGARRKAWRVTDVENWIVANQR